MSNLYLPFVKLKLIQILCVCKIKLAKRYCMCALLLQSNFLGKAQEVCLAMPIDDLLDYDAVKAEVLRSYERKGMFKDSQADIR